MDRIYTEKKLSDHNVLDRLYTEFTNTQNVSVRIV